MDGISYIYQAWIKKRHKIEYSVKLIRRKPIIKKYWMEMILKILGFIAILLLTSSAALPVLVNASQPTSIDVIIGIKSPKNFDELDVLVTSHGGRMMECWSLISAIHVTLPPQAIEAIEKNPNVLYIEEPGTVYVFKGKPTIPPGQEKPKPGQSQQPPQELRCGIDRIDADNAWDLSKGAGIKESILDTGIDNKHQDLDANNKGGVSHIGFRTSTNPKDWTDKHGHGTHVAGIIAAEDNDIGVIGVAPEAWLYAVKVIGDDGSGSVIDVIDGIMWAIENDMQVISMSFGGPINNIALQLMCDMAFDEGIILVAAAGNSGSDVMFPAAYNSVIAVSATDDSDSVPSWSCFGPEIELAAPGVQIKSTYLNDGYEVMDGTSMACPHVSGTVALVWAKNPSLNKWGVRINLQICAEDLGVPGIDYLYGDGLVNAEKSSMFA